MAQQTTPTKQGQICKFITPIKGENPNEQYILTTDPTGLGDEAILYVVSITQLQRNKSNPDNAKRIAVRKDEITVIADDLQSFIESFNK